MKEDLIQNIYTNSLSLKCGSSLSKLLTLHVYKEQELLTG